MFKPLGRDLRQGNRCRGQEKRTVAHLPKATGTALRREGAKAARCGRK
jgi:hypothetical protein